MLICIYEIEKLAPTDSGTALVHQFVSLLLLWDLEGEQLLVRLLTIYDKKENKPSARMRFITSC